MNATRHVHTRRPQRRGDGAEDPGRAAADRRRAVGLQADAAALPGHALRALAVHLPPAPHHQHGAADAAGGAGPAPCPANPCAGDFQKLCTLHFPKYHTFLRYFTPQPVTDGSKVIAQDASGQYLVTNKIFEKNGSRCCGLRAPGQS